MADTLAATDPPVIVGGFVAKQIVTDRLITPGVKVDDAIPDRGLAVVTRAALDMADLLDSGKSLAFVTYLADDVPGAPDDKLEWKIDSTSVWIGGAVRPDRVNQNPGLGTYGPELKGKRLRTVMEILGPPINVGSDYEVAKVPQGAP